MIRRSFLMLIGGSVAAATWDVTAAVPRLPFPVIDALPAFWKFWDSTVNEPEDTRVRAFFDSVVAAYPDLFHHGLIASGPLTDLGDVAEAQARVAKYLHDVGSYIPAMRRITTNIRDHFFRYAQEFSTTFPDYAPVTPVYFSVSLFGFSAGMLIPGENPGLYFGVDELARIYGSTGNLKVVFQHELFHQYHYQITPEISDDRSAWAFMWEEGLATYVSRRMNPGTTIDQVLVMPDRLSELALPHLPNLARRLLDHADSTDPSDYSDLFTMGQTQAGIPARSGYFVGYRVAEKLAATRSLVELVHMRGPGLKGAVLGVLAELQKAGEHQSGNVI
jgi:hypothetical protein